MSRNCHRIWRRYGIDCIIANSSTVSLQRSPVSGLRGCRQNRSRRVLAPHGEQQRQEESDEDVGKCAHQHGRERAAAAETQHRERDPQERGLGKQLEPEHDDLQDLVGRHRA